MNNHEAEISCFIQDIGTAATAETLVQYSTLPKVKAIQEVMEEGGMRSAFCADNA